MDTDLIYRVHSLETKVEKLADLDIRVSQVEKAQAVNHVEYTQIREDIKDIKSLVTWVTRLIIGSLILAVLTFLYGGGLAIAT